jgi:hypothetical protein
MDRMARRNVKAWLFTWEGDHGMENKVALLLRADTAESRVAELVALLYANACGSFGERLSQALVRDDAERPYRTRFAMPRGAERESHLMCGGNPCLYARRVERVTVDTGDDGAERLRWSEIEGD